MTNAPLSPDLFAPAPSTTPVREGYDSPGHILIVAEEWDEDTDGGRTIFDCAVADHIRDCGLTGSFQHRDDQYPSCWGGVERLAPGRYPIETWFETHPGGPWGPTEYSAGMRLVQPTDERGPDSD